MMTARSYHEVRRQRNSAHPNFAQNAATETPILRSLRIEMELERRAVGQRIAALRKRKRWTQPQAAERIGVSLRGVQDWEAGRSLPRWRNLDRLCEVYGVGPEDIIGAAEPASTPDVLAEMAADIKQILSRLDAQASVQAANAQLEDGSQERTQRGQGRGEAESAGGGQPPSE